jgi:uncharacterized membrane protein YqjE
MSTTTTPASPVNGSGPSVTELVSGIVGDIQNLGQQHFALFRHEVKEDFRKAGDAAASLAIGLAVAQVGGVLISFMLVYLLHELANFSMWSSFGIVGGVIVALGLIAVLYGIQKFKSLENLSKETADIIKDDARWLNQPK